MARHSSSQERRLLKQREAAAFLGVSEATIRRWVANDELEPVYVKGIRRFDREDLNALIEEAKAGLPVAEGAPSDA